MPLRPYLGQLVAQLAQSGVHHAVVAPGSRSTPLALLLHEHPRIRVLIALDERSAGYFALGLAKGLREPVALLCTSGTAAANFAPAVAEASLSRIPLIVLTADRPRELRDVGAAQTINQVHLYGSHVKWFQDLPTPGDLDLSRHAAQVAARAVKTAIQAPEGPVHLNFPLREPLLPEPGPMPQALLPSMDPAHVTASSEAVAEAAQWVDQAHRPLLALGPEAPALPDSVLDHFRRRGIVVAADPLSGNARRDAAWTGYDTVLRSAEAPAAPDLIIRLGAPFTSKAFQTWARDARLILLDWPGGFREPDQRISLIVEGDPAASLKALGETAALHPDAAWGHRIDSLDASAWRRVADLLENAPPSFEGRLYANLNDLWPKPERPVLVASSMPVRDLDTFYHSGPLRFYANRGANGIDGLVSTAMGLALPAGDILAVLGDLAFYHDMNGLLLAPQHQLNAFIVIVNNAGGAIFSFLSQRTLPDAVFEPLFGTPHHIDFSGVATLYGAAFRRAHDWAEFRQHFSDLRDRPGLRVLEWRTTPRTETVAVHRRLYVSS